MNIYKLKDNDLIVVNCKSIEGSDKFNGVYKIVHRSVTRDKSGVWIGGFYVILYPTKVTDTNGVKYAVEDKEFTTMHGQVCTIYEGGNTTNKDNIDNNVYTITFTCANDEEGEIISLGDNLYKYFEELDTNEIVRLIYWPNKSDKYTDMVDGYFEFNYTITKDTNLYVFTPLVDREPPADVKIIDMSDKAFIKDLGIVNSSLNASLFTLAVSFSLPIVSD